MKSVRLDFSLSYWPEKYASMFKNATVVKLIDNAIHPVTRCRTLSQKCQFLKSIDVRVRDLTTPSLLQDLTFPNLGWLRFKGSSSCSESFKLDRPSLKILSTSPITSRYSEIPRESCYLIPLVEAPASSLLKTLELDFGDVERREDVKVALDHYPKLKTLIVYRRALCDSYLPLFRSTLSMCWSTGSSSCPVLENLAIVGIDEAEVLKLNKVGMKLVETSPVLQRK